MDYYNFLEYVKCRIQKIMGEDASVNIMQVEKNNGVRLDGLIIHDKDRNVSPTIYLNPFYEQYQQGRARADIVNEIYQVYNKYSLQISLDTNFFCDYSRVRQNLTYKLVNYEKNKEFLEKVPYVRFLDLAIVFVVMLPECRDWKMENAAFVVRQEQLKIWNADIGDVYRDALYRTPELLPAKIQGIEEMLMEMLAENISQCEAGQKEKLFFQQELEELQQQGENYMYVLTNTLKLNGAACVLYPDVLRDFARKIGRNLFLLPSSIHEVLLIPEQDCEFTKTLRETVLEVNEYELETEEVLSDSIYYYDAEKDMISIWVDDCN